MPGEAHAQQDGDGGRPDRRGGGRPGNHRVRARLPLGGWANVLDWDPAGLRGHRLSGAPLAVARQLASTRASLGGFATKSTAAAIAALGVVLGYHAGWSGLLTLLLGWLAYSGFSSLDPNNAAQRGILDCVDRRILAVQHETRLSRAAIVRGTACAAALVTQLVIAPLLLKLCSGIFTVLLTVASYVFYLLLFALFFGLFYLLPGAVAHWTRTVFWFEVACCTMAHIVVAAEWPCGVARSFAQLNQHGWHGGGMRGFIRSVLQDRDWALYIVMQPIIGLLLLKTMALISSVRARCYSMTATASSWFVDCTALLGDGSSFTCVGENCVFSQSAFTEKMMHQSGYVFHVCATLAPAGYIVDNATGTCAAPTLSAESVDPAMSYWAWGFLLLWLACMAWLTKFSVDRGY